MTTAAPTSQPVTAARKRSRCGSADQQRDDAMAVILNLLDESPRSELFLRHWIEWQHGIDQETVLKSVKELLRQKLIAVDKTVTTGLDTQRILKLAGTSAVTQ